MAAQAIDSDLIAKAMRFHELKAQGAAVASPLGGKLVEAVDALVQPLVSSWSGPLNYTDLLGEAKTAIDEYLMQGNLDAKE